MKKIVTLSNGSRVSYWTYHPDAPVTMVLVHGFTGSHEGFRYIIPLLPNIKFIVPDVPGFGASEIDREDWSIDAIANRVNEFVACLKLPKPPYLLGHSMGGLVASSMLYQAPQLYDERVVLLSPVPTKITKNDSRRIGAIAGALQYHAGHRLPKVGHKIVKSKRLSAIATKLMLTTSDKELKKKIYEHHYANLDVINYVSDIEFYSKIHHDINRRGSIDYASAFKDKQLLLITGNRDKVTPLNYMQRFADAVKPSKFAIIDGVGHLAHYERAQEVANELKEFIPLP